MKFEIPVKFPDDIDKAVAQARTDIATKCKMPVMRNGSGGTPTPFYLQIIGVETSERKGRYSYTLEVALCCAHVPQIKGGDDAGN